MAIDRAPAPPGFAHRTAFKTFLFVLALAYANEFFDWRITGIYDWEWIVAVTLLGVIYLPFFILSGLRR